MFIGHLPAGFLLTRWLQERLQTTKFLWVGLVASVFPDIDMLYFYLIDDRQTLHHQYWTHLPLVWIALWLLMIMAAKILKNRTVYLVTMIVFANIVLHFILDSIVGGIGWLYPFVDYDVSLFSVPTTHDFWVWSFVFHWTFLFEIAVIFAAGALLYKEYAKKYVSK